VPNAIGYAAKHSFSRLKPIEFDREHAGPGEIEIEILYCGVCHSDLHQCANDWSNAVYPCMPGHEIVGRVTTVGEGAVRHSVGDIVGIGCMIDSCRTCEPCLAGEENYCEGPNGWLATYNGPFIPAAKAPNGGNMYGRKNTYGGYSNQYTVREDFALKIPEGLAPEVAAPILCAGATTYSPMKHWGVKAGDHVGVIGIGGLGHMAIKIAVAMGAKVTAFTSSKDKIEDIEQLGSSVVIEDDKQALKTLENSFDFMLSTIPEKHDINPFIPLLKRDKTIVLVGALEPMKGVDNSVVAFYRKSMAGSIIGSLAETQEILDFCAEHKIGPDVEIIPIQKINDAFKELEKGDVRFRYVIDMASLREQEAD
jgi:alcohol dehydrogenase (NADP+)